MTNSAQKFASPITFQAISNIRVYSNLVQDFYDGDINHMKLAQKSDLIIVTPAMANIILKASCGVADDLVSSIIGASKAPIIFIPAMNTTMYENPVVRENIKKICASGYGVIEPDIGLMATRMEAAGIERFPNLYKIIEYIRIFTR